VVGRAGRDGDAALTDQEKPCDGGVHRKSLLCVVRAAKTVAYSSNGQPWETRSKAQRQPGNHSQ
jgi:hypothetical protein